MLKFLKNNRGFSLVETLFVMALLAVFGAATYALVAVGGDTYKRVVSNRDVDASLRTASSFISMRVRQSDEFGAVSVKKDGDLGDMLVISQDVEGSGFFTYIYMYGDSLFEAGIGEGVEFSPEAGFEICKISGLDIDYSDEGPSRRAIEYSVYAVSGEKRMKISSIIGVRS